MPDEAAEIGALIFLHQLLLANQKSREFIVSTDIFAHYCGSSGNCTFLYDNDAI